MWSKIWEWVKEHVSVMILKESVELNVNITIDKYGIVLVLSVFVVNLALWYDWSGEEE